ncbi:unnamed protein product [Ceutorhynchus assimilis]|uniref:CCHC-type domain-containing protein n=1 Tax=Ceutorhynchus assimilis TaxID=467358 RepID=A0A9N9N260_9CUCU|nr:unnamed protein product [Ceutorhynchus assimilis]
MDLENEAAGGPSQTQITVEEIVNIAIHALQVKEAQDKKVSFSEISSLVSEFSGSEDVVAWFQCIDAIKIAYKVSEDMLKLVIINKLTGTAKRWFHSCPSNAALTLSRLELEMTRMFKCQEDRLAIMKKFEARRWRRNEKFCEYYFDKILMGKQLNLADTDLVNYLIEGFDDPILQTQAKMKEFSSTSKLLEPHTPSYTPVNKTQYVPPVVRRCFNCYEEGHLANNCSKPRRARGSCFECQATDHQVKDCPRRKGRQPERRSAQADSTVTYTSSTNVTQDIFPAYMVTCIFRKYLNYEFDAIIDTGSPISLVKESVINREDILPHDSSQNFYGLNKTPLKILGCFEDIVIIADCEVKNIFHVVSDDTMSFDVLLGRNFMSNDLELPNVRGSVKDKVSRKAGGITGVPNLLYGMHRKTLPSEN